ncbi:hypothetical protein HNR44_001069 [Geomicrobium halophilum]|uniref:Uncharacterized protein n=1 Tax=Geomicrobium halophilum TaxID=549000 RepID=A0A841PK12_9BACL|nr:hypothetical protein [Geomicrobium halophilum]MBB6449120.1 hypothetical protein [Geomicrobium halophilum]
MPVQSKARELCAAIQMRGWSNTQLFQNQHQDIILNSRTGCRSWKGTKWGFISAGTPDHLNISIDLPRDHFQIENISLKLEMDIINCSDVDISGVYLEHKHDRDTLHILLCQEELDNAEFSDSALVDLLSEIRRLNCL